MIKTRFPLFCLIAISLSFVSAASAQDTTPLSLMVRHVTSSSIDLSWGLVSGVDEVRVFIGPEPPNVRDTPLPMQHQVASLAGNISSHTIDNLAAAVDVFIRIEVLSGGQFISGKNAHARTLGGPRANLNTPLREVHLVAPNIIQLVLANPRVHSFTTANDWFDSGIDEVIGLAGTHWQAGPWTILRNDGSPITVQDVYRHSIPVGQPYYEVGYRTSTHDNLLDVDHKIYLELAEPVGSPEVLRITRPSFSYEILTEALTREMRSASVDFLLPFSDRYLETPVIKVNQVGYSPWATRRYAYVSEWMGDGGPLALASFPATAEVLQDMIDPLAVRPRVVQDLPITLRSALDAEGGSEVRELDLASVPAAEAVVYRVRVPDVGVSWPTQVSKMAVFKAFFTVMRGLYHNRWGRDLDPAYTEWAPRPPDHLTVFTAERNFSDRFFPKDRPHVGERALSGGHHDAGDFDIAPTHYTLPMMLMRAFELQPHVYLDRQLNIPESGNGIPDLLDEVLWSLAAWEQLQEPDGGVRAGVESWRHPWGIYFADEDPLPFWTFSVDAEHTARVAALFAQAARLVKPFSLAIHDRLSQRAVSAYNFARSAGLREVGPSGSNATDPQGEMLYAASELFRLTGDPIYGDRFVEGWDSGDKWGGGGYDSTWPYLPHPIFGSGLILDYHHGYLGSPLAQSRLVDVALDKLTGMADSLILTVNDKFAFRNARRSLPGWGKGVAVGEYMMGIYSRMQLGGLTSAQQEAYSNAISLSGDYVLGCNELGQVWITGLGSRSPQDPLHLDSLSFLHQGKLPIPGIPVNGPHTAGNEFANRLTYPSITDHPIMRQYMDVHFDVKGSEFELTVHATQAQLFAILLKEPMMPPAARRHRAKIAR